MSIWEKDDVLGGKLDVASRAPSKDEVLTFQKYQSRVLEELGVDIHTGSSVDADTISRVGPDVLVLATGSTPFVPPIPGIDGPTTIDAQEVLLERHTIPADHQVVVIGGSATGVETAEYLMDRVASVSIVEMLPFVGRGVEMITRKRLYKELLDQGVQILTRCTVTMIQEDRLRFEREDGTADELEADTVVLAIGWRPTGERFVESLNGDVDEVVMVGDADRPGDFVAAINAGADAGLTI